MTPDERDERTFTATAVWLRRSGDRVQLLVEIDGDWLVACEEHIDGPFSHIAEASGRSRWKPDPLTKGDA